MPGLFLPRFRPNDAIDARQIDKCVQALSDVLNGGLTADNLAPNYRISAAQFTENRAAFALKAFVTPESFASANLAEPLFGAVPYAASVIGLGYTLKAVSATSIFSIRSGSGGGPVLYTHYVNRREIPVTIGGVQYLIGFVQPRLPEIIAANTVLLLQWPTMAGTSPVGAVTLFLSAGWQ